MDSDPNYIDIHDSVKHSHPDLMWPEQKSRFKNRTIGFHPGDIQVLQYIQETLGCSTSEAVRSSIRAFASQLAQMEKRTSGRLD